MQPLIVYFPHSSQWLSRAVSKSNHKDFLNKVQEMFDKLSSRIVLICGQNKAENGSKERKICKFLKFIKFFTPIHKHAHLKHLNSIVFLSFRYHSCLSFFFLFLSHCIFSLQISFNRQCYSRILVVQQSRLAKLVRLPKLLKHCKFQTNSLDYYHIYSRQLLSFIIVSM